MTITGCIPCSTHTAMWVLQRWASWSLALTNYTFLVVRTILATTDTVRTMPYILPVYHCHCKLVTVMLEGFLFCTNPIPVCLTPFPMYVYSMKNWPLKFLQLMIIFIKICRFLHYKCTIIAKHTGTLLTAIVFLSLDLVLFRICSKTECECLLRFGFILISALSVAPRKVQHMMLISRNW